MHARKRNGDRIRNHPCCRRLSGPLVVAVALALPSIALLASPCAAQSTSTDVTEWAAYLREVARVRANLDDKGERKVIALGQRSASSSVRSRARFDEMSFAARKNMQAAQGHWSALGGVASVVAVGPFAGASSNAFKLMQAFEVRTFELDGTFTVKNGTQSWQQLSALIDSGVLRVDPSFEETDGAIFGLAFIVSASRDCEVVLHASASGPLSVRVDDTAVMHVNEASVLGYDAHAVSMKLPKGRHLVRMRIGSGSRLTSVRVRMTGLNGERSKALTFPPIVDDNVRSLPKSFAPIAFARWTSVASEALDMAVQPIVSTSNLLDAALVLEDTGAFDARKSPTTIDRIYRRAIKSADREAESAARISFGVDARIRLARRLMEEDPAQALVLFRAAFALAPENLDVVVGLAQLFDREGRSEEARAMWRQVFTTSKTRSVARLQSLRFLRQQGRGTLALDLEAFALARTSSSTDALLFAAEVAEDREDRARVRELLEQVARRQPTHESWLLFLRERARNSTKIEDTETYIAVMRDRLKLRPHFHRLAEELALTLLFVKRTEDAAVVVEERTRRYPASASGWRTAATIAFWQQENVRARTALVVARELRPQDQTLRRMWRATSPGEDAVLDRYPVDLDALLKMPPSEEAKKTGAEIVLARVGARFFENGLGHFEREEVIRIVDAKLSRGQEVRSFAFASGREEIEVLRAEVRHKNGETSAPMRVEDEGQGFSNGVYSDERTLTIQFAPLQEGDVLHVVVREDLIGRQNLFGDFFGLLEPVTRELPTKKHVAIFDTPASRPLAYGGRNVAKPTIVDNGERKLFIFERSNVARMKSERLQPPYWSVGDYLSVSTYESWEDLGKWYEGLIDGQLDASEDVVAAAIAAVGDATSTREKVRRIYEWVVTHTRYVGIELGIHGWKPYAVNTVFRRGFGDCKDKASLMVAMLAAVDVGAQIALVRTADLGPLSGSPPTMWAFNHAIAYIPALDVYLDGTAEQTRAFDLPAVDQGATTLLVTPKIARSLVRNPQARLTTIPLRDLASNLNRSDYDLQFDTYGNVKFIGEEKFWGEDAAARRRRLADVSRRAEFLGDELAHTHAGAQIDNVGDVEASISASPVRYKFEGTLPGFAKAVVDGYQVPLSLYPHSLVEHYAPRSERTQDLWLTHPSVTTNVVRFRFPVAATVWSLPSSKVVRSKHLSFSQEVVRTSDGFAVTETLQIKSRQIPVSDYAAFREAAVTAEALMYRMASVRFDEDDS